MSLTLYYHPLASYCHKVLIALYERQIPFLPRFIDLSDETQRAELSGLWPFTKFPVLRDHTNDQNVPESTIIIEYLELLHDGAPRLIPEDPEQAWRCRSLDRLFDLYVHEPMQKIVADRLRPAELKDGHGVELAHKTLETAYELLEERMQSRTWAFGDHFTIADCAAAPALFYAQKVHPFEQRPHLAAYHRRLLSRPSYARVLQEAEPYMANFPT